MAPTQVRLSDLRKTKAPCVFEEEHEGEPVRIEVLVVKLGDTDLIACNEAADAAKARSLLNRAQEGSDEWLALYGQTVELGEGPEPLLELLSAFHVMERTEIIQAEVAGTEGSKWAKDNYLDGLLTAWRGTEHEPGLMLAWHAKDDDPDTLDPALAQQIPEAVRVFDEIDAFEKVVSERIEAERQRWVRDHEHEDIEKLRRMAVDRALEDKANNAWLRVYDRAVIFYATREVEDHTVRYFQSPAEVATTDREFRAKLLATYRGMSLDGAEGKGSQAPQSSLPQSGSSGEGETLDASGPTAATA